MAEKNTWMTFKVFNSLRRKKDTFRPNQNEPTKIKWYSCGPTVYDVAHLGHARCYMSFDILRRILVKYLGYDVQYVMNITDIDDKIIKRARSNHLWDNFIDNYETDKLVDTIQKSIDGYRSRRENEKDPDKLKMVQDVLSNSQHALKVLEDFLKSGNDKTRIEEQLVKLRDVVADELDSQLGHTITDHQIFKALTMKFEQEFHEDMERLNVLPPSCLTRVSEFIEQIGAYIVKIEENGFAYRSNGSIYFDTNKFDSDPKHTYAKLVREAYGQNKDLEEGELSQSHQGEKRSANDFALWKKSKAGEPSWKTQDFEAGRPGWHIECSVMASNIFGEQLDIHSGGHDLRFPHHDNEIAQAEAYYDTGRNWVRYFIHSGHLEISGCKMSKSLKNFITIRQALEEYTARQLRFLFLSHRWTETLNYSENTINIALGYEKMFRRFFYSVFEACRRLSDDDDRLAVDMYQNTLFTEMSPQDFQSVVQDHIDSFPAYSSDIKKIDAALRDNFDTRTALSHMSNIVKRFHKSSTSMQLDELMFVANYVRNLLAALGAEFDDIKLDLMKYLNTLANFRARVRDAAKSGDVQRILVLCDELRDKTLPELGVAVEDKGQAGVVVDVVDEVTLDSERRRRVRLGNGGQC